MSQMTATARPLRAPSRGARRGTGIPPLRVIPSRIKTTGNGGFAAACLALLTLGLIALLLLNTALAQGSIALGQLQREATVLSDSASNLQEQIDASSASGALALKASQLGMVRTNERAFIDLAKGTVTGTASPATRQQAFPIVTSPTPPPEAAKKVASAGKSATLAAGQVAAAAAAAKPTVRDATPAAKPAAKPATTSTAPPATAPAAKPTTTSTAPPAATPKTAGAAAGGAPTATLGTTPQTGKPAATQPKPTTPAAPR